VEPIAKQVFALLSQGRRRTKEVDMETWEWIVIAAVAGAAAILLLALFSFWRKRRRRAHLQDRFGDEYQRTVSSEGRREGERQLGTIEEEHDDLDLRPLTPAARDRYLEEWRQAESRFVSDPHDAARSAERIVIRALEECGYPSDIDAERRAAHVAVDHPNVGERYRHGHAMLDSDGDASTEDLRKAMMDFRVVLDEVVVEDREKTTA
jgi:hypothetical protein